jgi:hypothetical protein
VENIAFNAQALGVAGAHGVPRHDSIRDPRFGNIEFLMRIWRPDARFPNGAMVEPLVELLQ